MWRCTRTSTRYDFVHTSLCNFNRAQSRVIPQNFYDILSVIHAKLPRDIVLVHDNNFYKHIDHYILRISRKASYVFMACVLLLEIVEFF